MQLSALTAHLSGLNRKRKQNQRRRVAIAILLLPTIDSMARWLHGSSHSHSHALDGSLTFYIRDERTREQFSTFPSQHGPVRKTECDWLIKKKSRSATGFPNVSESWGTGYGNRFNLIPISLKMFSIKMHTLVWVIISMALWLKCTLDQALSNQSCLLQYETEGNGVTDLRDQGTPPQIVPK